MSDSIARGDRVLVNRHIAGSVIDGMRDPEQVLGKAFHELSQKALLLRHLLGSALVLLLDFRDLGLNISLKLAEEDQDRL